MARAMRCHPVVARGRPAFLALLVLATGCVSSTALPLGPDRYPPRDPSHRIVLYDTIEDVPKPFIKVARVFGEGSSKSAWQDIVAAMQEKARAAGADALVLGPAGHGIDGADEGGIHYDKVISALAVRFGGK